MGTWFFYRHNSTMTITLNGKTHEIPANSSLTDLIQQLGLTGKPVVIELNRLAIFSRDYATTMIPENAVIEIVTLAAGG